MTSTTTARPNRSSGFAHLLWKLLAPFLGLLLVLFFFQAKRPDAFLKAGNLKFVAAQTVYVALPAVGMTFIIISGGIDLSVGSVMALCGVLLALMIREGVPIGAAVALTILAGGVVGFINGVLITSLRIIPFIVTLGMLGIARGVAKALAGDSMVRVDDPPLGYLTLPVRSSMWWEVAPSVWIMIAVAIGAAVLLNLTGFGRRTFAIGSNELAARFSGLAVNRQKWMVYTLGGMLTGLAGVMIFANIGMGDPTAAGSMELQVIAAVVIGGGSLMGGAGSILGTMIGAFMLTFLVNGCTMAGYKNWMQEIVIGAIIILAVALDYFRRRSPR